MKIAILGTRGIPSGYSGYEAFAEEIGVRLAGNGHVVTIYAHANRFQEQPGEYRGIKMIYLPCLKGKNTSQLSHSIMATFHAIFIKRQDIVLFCNAANGPFGLLLRMANIRCAINVDGMEWQRPKWGSLAKKYFKWAARMATKYFDVVVTDAKGMQDVYFKEFNCKSVNIAYGADIKYSEKPELIQHYGLMPHEYYLIASRLVPDNNADLIVKAFAKSSTKRKLAIAGGAAYRNPFEDKLKKLSDDRVIFLGHIDDSGVIKELHCNAYAYIHGHEYGGTNPALLKSLAYGNCVLALDTVFNREVLQEGEYGILYKKDVTDLLGIIEEIDSNKEKVKAFSRRSREQISKNYTWEKITEQYLELFNSLVRS